MEPKFVFHIHKGDSVEKIASIEAFNFKEAIEIFGGDHDLSPDDAYNISLDSKKLEFRYNLSESAIDTVKKIENQANFFDIRIDKKGKIYIIIGKPSL